MSPTKKIQKLTPLQEALLERTYSEWLAIGRNTAPLNREKVTDVVCRFYAEIGKPRPVVTFFSSSLMCILAWGALRELAKKNKDSQLGSQLDSQLDSQLGSQIRSQLGSQLDSQLYSQLDSQLDSQIRSQLRSQLGSQLGNRFGAQHWCAWEVFYLFCHQIGVTYTPAEIKLLNLWLEQSRELHWWFPYDGIVLCSERHNILSVDDRGRLHSDKGQSVGYTDGWGLWSWHGVNVPKEVIESPDKITVKQIDAEQNAEVRRVMIERYGQSRYLTDSGAKLIHQDSLGKLWAKEIPGDEPLVMVEVKNSTPEPDGSFKNYFLRVPPDIREAKQAVAWTFGMKPQEYKPVQES